LCAQRLQDIHAGSVRRGLHRRRCHERACLPHPPPPPPPPPRTRPPDRSPHPQTGKFNLAEWFPNHTQEKTRPIIDTFIA
ncbi:unnamed protein product, partial [Mycena citricolor]